MISARSSTRHHAPAWDPSPPWSGHPPTGLDTDRDTPAGATPGLSALVRPRLLALGLLLLAPLAGAALAALTVPHTATAQGEAVAPPRPSAGLDTQAAVAPIARADSPAITLRQDTEAEVLRLTRLLRDVRRERANTGAAGHAAWDDALSALIAGRAGHATVSGALRRTDTPPPPERLAALGREARAAAAEVRRGHALLAVARRQSGLPSAGRGRIAAATPVLTGPVNPLDPAVPMIPRSAGTPPPRATAHPAPPRVADPAAPVAPAVPVPSRDIAERMGLVGPMMDRPSTMITGPLALPPRGVAPFQRGGPADWQPALSPLARPRSDPAVRVNPAFAGPMPAYEALEPAMGQPSATAPPRPRPAVVVSAPSPASALAPSLAQATPRPVSLAARHTTPNPVVTREPPPAVAIAAPAPSPGRAPVRPSAPPRDTPVSRIEPPRAPTPATVTADPPQLADRGRATRPVPFDVRPRDPAGDRATAPSGQFAAIAAQVAVEREKAARILGRIGPVRADLTRRSGTLPADDPRRADLREVLETVDKAEANLRAALGQYDGLRRQLDWAISMLEKGQETGSQWSPRDASRQAIAASVQARQGVTGLKLAMGQFEQVMGLRSGGVRVSE
ncbi:hypothetical protein [Roseospira visakhapatnamensis]|uniref:Uncharacterized protein n=1 Tax=Roseospira visakhapatnamensis TaxID=390880 RepID=A0A7W6RC67_9PROT|nr:hypothetical protein [Roseospira visakhapatnamensis]MBB4265747.1 hypothetical protein [Roseospira visakhapatnamensis]